MPQDKQSLLSRVRLDEIRGRMALAAKAAQRDPASITLVAVSKTFDASVIKPYLLAGQRVFGENRVQEAAGKWPSLRAGYSDVELHLIGPLQTNKLDEALDLFDVIETLDREKLALALVKARDKGRRLPRLLVQVNTGAEPQKAGLLPAAVPGFLQNCRDQWHLDIEGLMCIPPVDAEPGAHFALLAQLARAHGLHKLSMGMSADFEIAIRAGATHIRLGGALFGGRG